MSRTIARLHGEWLLKRVARGKNATRSKGVPSAAGLAGGPAIVGVVDECGFALLSQRLYCHWRV